MTLVFENATAGPATHALVIGVGRYDHLAGGGGPLLPEHEGLGQLSSPPVSARAVADWLEDTYRHPAKPLASLRLVLSEKAPAPYRGHDVEDATIDAVEASVLAWKQAGDQNPENLLIFHFCGHGLGSGSDLALLASDYGENHDNALNGALDFRKLHLGMRGRCEAKEVVYFVDACRVSTELTNHAEDHWGRVPVLPKVPKPGRQGPTFFSTLLGAQAYGRKGRPSRFTEALLHGLGGAGADDSDSEWRVSTTGLKRAIDGAMARAVEAGEMSAQVPPTSDLTTFPLHYPAEGPRVPVFVRCRPEAANPFARLACSAGGATLHERAPSPEPWDLELGVGTYSFGATFEQGPPYVAATANEVIVYPPHKVVPLRVEP